MSYINFIRQEYPSLGFGFLLFLWSNFGQSFFIAWFGAPIQESLGMSAAVYSSAYSLATLGSAASIVFIGRYIDRVSLTRYLIFVGVGLTSAMLLLASSVGYASLLVAFFLLRLFGQGLLPHTGQTIMARRYQHDRGKAISISLAGRPIGEVLLPSFILLTMTVLNWRSAWLLYALIGAIVLLPTLLLLSSRASAATVSRVTAGDSPAASDGLLHTQGHTVAQVLRDPGFWLILPIILAAPLVTTGIFIHQGFILSAKSWEPGQFASGFVVFGLTHWVSMLVTGVLIDRFRAVSISKLSMIPLTLAIAVMNYFDGQVAIFGFMFLAGVSVGAIGPISGAIWAEVYGLAHFGAVRSVVVAMMVLSTAVAPFAAGLAIDAGIPLNGILTTVLSGMVISFVAALPTYR